MDRSEYLEAALSWLGLHYPQLYAAGMSAGVAILRVAYGRGGYRQMLFEGLLCGCLTLCIVPALDWLSLPPSLATFAGGAMGFMGVDRVRVLADRWTDKKVPKQ